MSKVNILLLKIGMNCLNLGDLLKTYLDENTNLDVCDALIDQGSYSETKCPRTSLAGVTMPQTIPLLKNRHNGKDIYDNIVEEWGKLELDDLILDFTTIRNIRYVTEHSLRKIDLNEYDIIGLSCIDNSMLAAIICMNYIRKHFPDKKIIVGGPFIYFNQSFMDILVEENLIDTYVIGDGELALPRFVELYRDNADNLPVAMSMPVDNLNDIPQTTVCDSSGYLFSSRSCPHKCEFCQPRRFGKYRTVSVEVLANAIRNMNVNHNAIHFYMHDNMFNKSKQYILDFHDEIRKMDLLGKISVWSTLRPNNMDEDVLEALSDLHSSFSVGIESFSQPVLDLMNKKSSVPFLLRLLGNLEKYDGIVFLHNMFGFPGETLKMFNESLKVFVDTTVPVIYKRLNFFVLTKDSNVHLHPEDHNVEIVPFPDSVVNYFPSMRTVLNENPMNYIDLTDPIDECLKTKRSVKAIVDPILKNKTYKVMVTPILIDKED